MKHIDFLEKRASLKKCQLWVGRGEIRSEAYGIKEYLMTDEFPFVCFAWTASQSDVTDG